VAEPGLRVVLTVPSLAREFGGPVDVALGLGDALRDLGAQVRLVGAGAGEGLGDEDGLPVVTTVRGTPVPRSFRALRSALDRADVVHILGYRDPVGTVAARSAARAGIPYLLEPCGMHRPRLRSVPAKHAFDRAIGRWIVSRATFVIATSELEHEELVEDGVSDGTIRTRLNGLTLPSGDAPTRGRIRERFGVPSDAPLVLSLGRIARKKGLIDLVRAATDLPSVHVMIVGPDSGDGTLGDVARAAREIDGRVHVDADGLWGPDKFAALVDADCFALPSMTENFGNAAAEAAAVGLPVVVSDACGVAEVLDATAHRVVPVGSPGALARAIGELVVPEARPRAAAVAGDLRALLDWSRLGEQQLAIYREAVRR
jgi:glycosyltransferase involved in cell wall biosynthesis